MGRGVKGAPVGSLESLRELNRLRVIDALRRNGTASRSELARLTGLSRTTVVAVVGDLLQRGLVVERPEELPQEGARGRPPVMLRLNPRAAFVLGIDVGHSHVRVAVGDLSSTVLAHRVEQLDVDQDAVLALDTAVRLAEEALDEVGVDRSRLLGAGLGLPGPIDRSRGSIGSSIALPGWEGVNAREHVSRRLDGLHVEIDNDANLGALAEVSFGAGRGLLDVVYVKVATGIGAGLVLDGVLHRGSSGIAGELGHVSVRTDGAVCTCGNRGCLQTVAAAGPLLEVLGAAHGAGLTVPEMLKLADGGDHAARRVLQDAGRDIGRVLADLCNHLNPAAVVVGGDLAAAGEPLLSGVRASIERHALPGVAEAVSVLPAVLGERAEVLGALLLVTADTERLASAGLAALHEPVAEAAG